MCGRGYSRAGLAAARRGERGVTAIEYALVAVAASLAVFAGGQQIGRAIVRVLAGLAAQPFW